MECQLHVAQTQRLSLSLKKSKLFPQRFEFVGVNVCTDGNRPAQSKHQLLQHWATPVIVRDVAKFVGFLQFYSCFIPHFEVQISAFCELMKEDYASPLALGSAWMPTHLAIFDEMRNAILDDPCLKWYNCRKLLFLRTDFSANGFGYVALQPGNDNTSLSAMHTRMRGSDFLFMTKVSTAVLHPVAFGCCRTRSNKKRLHSHLGECFSGDWAINKCHHMCFGQRFTWTTDCHTIKFILSYDGRNPAILRLQMRFMCWDMDIKHRNDIHLADADYFSWLGSDLCYDRLLRNYIERIHALKRDHPCPSTLPIEPQYMPYYHKPTFPNVPDTIPTVATTLVPTITGSQHLANWPVLLFGFSASPSNPALPVQKFFPSAWFWLPTCSLTLMDTHCSRNLPHVPLSCPALLPFLITYVDPVSHPNSWAISFTCIATTVASSPKSFGTSRLTLLPNSGSFNPYQFL